MSWCTQAAKSAMLHGYGKAVSLAPLARFQGQPPSADCTALWGCVAQHCWRLGRGKLGAVGGYSRSTFWRLPMHHGKERYNVIEQLAVGCRLCCSSFCGWIHVGWCFLVRFGRSRVAKNQREVSQNTRHLIALRYMKNQIATAAF